MNALARRRLQNEGAAVEVTLAGELLLCDPTGVVYAPSLGAMIVSDLHLEKGAAFARRGMMLPPYDTAVTLSLLEAAVARYCPRTLVCLGDSFHDRHGAAMMPLPFRQTLATLMLGRDWIWIAGNHDPEAPTMLGGETASEIVLGPWTLRHEPSETDGAAEIAGHLHPSARLVGNGSSYRGACFATDGRRMIMPSFGITTGGLNVLDRAFDRLFELDRATAYVIGRAAIYPIPFAALSRG